MLGVLNTFALFSWTITGSTYTSLAGTFSISSSLVMLFVFSELSSCDTVEVIIRFSFADFDLKKENRPLPCWIYRSQAKSVEIFRIS